MKKFQECRVQLNFPELDSLALKKLFRMVRFTTFIFFLSLMQAVAVDSYAQMTKLSLNVDNERLEKVLETIEDESEFFFLYNKDLIDVEQEVSVDAQNEPIKAILDGLLVGKDIAYTVYNRQIVLSNTEVISKMVAQQNSVSGTVTDESGEPLPGVTVLIKGTTNGTVSNMDGKYTISNLPEGSTLVFSFVGMLTQEIAVGNQTTINVTMAMDAIGLEEVVAIGYGTVRKSDLTSAISKVSGSDLKDRVVSRLDEALQGKMAGVSVQQSSGLPGAAPVIRIRGTNSITGGNQPLWVIDGMPIEDASIIANINMNDAQSIEVLKDAAAAAIYGSRASNGVIIVTTKAGKLGKPTVSYNMHYGIQSAEKRLEFLSGPEQGELMAEYRAWEWASKGNDPNVPNADRAAKYRIDPNWLTGNVNDYDIQDHIFRNAPVQNHNLSLSGGTEKSKYFMSLDYLNQEGIAKGTGFERFSIRTNLESQVNDFIKVGLNVSASSSTQMDANVEGKDRGLNVLINGPLVDAADYYFADDGYTMINDYAKEYGLQHQSGRLYGFENMEQQYVRPQLLVSSFIDIKLLDGLNFRTTGHYKYNALNFSDRKGIILGGGNPSASISNSYASDWTIENTLNYNKKIGGHSISGLLGYSSQKYYSEYSAMSGRGFANELSLTLNNATEINSWNESIQEWSLISMFARATYNYESRYLLTASIRRDGSSRFGSNNKWGTFPSASAAWRVNKEAFMADIKTISNLKLRLSYGETGNNRIGNYAHIATLSVSNPVLGAGETINSGLVPGGFENKDLTWERTLTTNIGVDIGFIDNRINLSIDAYEGITKDLLLTVPVPLTTGFSSAIQNLGEVSNKGIEIELATRNLASTSAFQWNTKLNYSYNKNEVLKMGPNDAPIITGEWYSRSSYTGIGEAIGSFYLWETDGVFQNQAELDAGPIFKTEGIGDVRFLDKNGDNVIDADDRTVLGQPMPKYHFGITNDFSYKNFDLSIFINGAGGHQQYFVFSRYTDRFSQTSNNVLSRWTGRWKSESDPGDGVTPKITSKAGTNGKDEEQDAWLHDADWWRIKNLTLGYNVPKSALAKFKISGLRVYASADNLLLKTKYIGFNPEGVFGPGQLNRGANQAESAASRSWGYDFGNSLPQPKTFILGLNVTF